ncbi:MAG TPA: hypothetical protein VF543_19275 [Pyrinomonadaceae bacterium]|jgi:hypothetical protein
MARDTTLSEEIADKFNHIAWHDSKFINLELLPDSDGIYDLSLKVKLPAVTQSGEDEWEDRRLVLKECRIIQLDLDLFAMQLTGGDIASAICEIDAEEREKLERDKLKDFDLPQEDYPLNDFLFFKITLIHPGGDLKVFAKSFELM